MKNKNLMYWLLAFLLLGAFLIYVGADNSVGIKEEKTTSIVSEGELSVLENDFDFGEISMKGGTVSRKFEIINNGEESVRIEKIYTSCACTTAYIDDSSGKRMGKFGMPGHKGLRSDAGVEVGAGESVFVEAVYDPAFHGPSAVGFIQRSVYIETNSKLKPKLELKFQAMVSR